MVGRKAARIAWALYWPTPSIFTGAEPVPIESLWQRAWVSLGDSFPG